MRASGIDDQWGWNELISSFTSFRGGVLYGQLLILTSTHPPRIKEIVEVEKVLDRISVCQLEPLWRRPRNIEETFHGSLSPIIYNGMCQYNYVIAAGVTFILSPWYFQAKNYSDQLLCIWNVSCPADHALFVNSTSIRLQSM